MLNEYISNVSFPYGMTHPVGENDHYSMPTADIVTSNDGIFCFEYNTLI